jgi:hypothetical protein
LHRRLAGLGGLNRARQRPRLRKNPPNRPFWTAFALRRAGVGKNPSFWPRPRGSPGRRTNRRLLPARREDYLGQVRPDAAGGCLNAARKAGVHAPRIGAGNSDTLHMLEWNIQPRAHACQDCGRAFKKGESLHTLLFDERQAYRRLDVCEGCWQAQHAQGDNHRRGFVSHWVSQYEPPPPEPPEPIARENAESLLRKLAARNAPEFTGSVFVLAVMLERKRVLKAKAQTREGDRRILIYEHARTGEVFPIVDPELRLDQLDTVQREVAQLLERGLPAESNPPPAAAEASPGSLETSSPGTVPPPAAGPPPVLTSTA